MFGTIRKHQKWLWFVIIAFMIVGLVTYFTPASQSSRGQAGGANYGSINGVPITKEDFDNAQREAYLVYVLMYGSNSKVDFDMQRETYQRLFIIQRLKELGIHIDNTSIAQAADNILRQFGRGKPVPLDAFLKEIVMSRVNAEDFERYVRHQLGLEQLVSIVGLSGELVTPAEAHSLYVRDHQEVATEAVFFTATNFLAGIPAPAPGAVAEFFTNRMADYRLPERVQVSYVSFDVTNYMAEADRRMAEVTNADALVEQVYQQRGTNSYNDAKSPAEAKQKIRAEMRHELAQAEAKKKANEFATVLFDQNPVQPENLAAQAKASGLAVKVTRPFDEETGPAEFDGGPNFAREAFSRKAEEPFGGPLAGENAVYVIALDKRIPSEVPALDSVHERVLADYKNYMAVLLAQRTGAEFAQALAKGLAQKKTFAAICADAKVKPVTIPPLSISMRELPAIESLVSLSQFKQTVFTTPLDNASPFSPTVDGGFVVYVERRLPIDEAKMAADMPTYFNAVRQARRQEAVKGWFDAEAPRALRDTPLARPRPSSLAPTADKS